MKKIITCHFCFQNFEIILDTFNKANTEIWDCEICCNPINIVYGFENQDLVHFDAQNLEDNF